ncbi:DUF2306 domain-containing protein [Neobacillus jeddahensis]|uniref:DUF2306 domain-containing protein n=1 Tax=Neobacillus jeddahensis TaxID=1461580 RepID=UPI001FCB68AB|nr:DUF2306 domain-containing protein [Neobacillus jeddahensis]
MADKRKMGVTNRMKASKGWWLLVIVSIGVMSPFVAPYLTFDPGNSRVSMTPSSLQFPLLVAHIGTACVALISGFFQFLESIRIKAPKLHRNLGRVYVGSVFLSGGIALVYLFYVDNFSKAISFLVLAMIWIYTCWKGYRTALKKRFAEHRKWMIRSFAVTLVAVSARLLVPFLLLAYAALHRFSLPGGRMMMVEEVLNVNIWVGLLVNFIVVEWKILKPKKDSLTE